MHLVDEHNGDVIPIRLKKINITDNAMIQSSHFEKFIRVVGTHGALNTFEFKQAAGLDGRLIIDGHVLMPLLPLGNLESVHIYGAFRFGNDMVQTMVNAWPRLRSLHLGLQGWSGCSQITIAGLLPLMKLPALCSLSISIDASVVDHTLEMPPVSTPNHNICHIWFQDSIIEDPFAVAGFLSDLFPSLDTIEAWGILASGDPSVSREAVNKYEARWQEVARLVPLLAKVRQQQRRWNPQLAGIGGLTLQ